MNMIAVWAVATIVFLVVEAIVPGLTSIWFALGSICSLIAALLNAPYWLQIIWFIVISIGTLILTRPLAKKFVNGKVQATNADRNIGMRCVVTERIDNLAQTGAVLCDGKIWTARSCTDDETMEVGEIVIAKEITGVRLIVSPATKENMEVE